MYIDVDGSKKYGFGTHVYHVKGDPEGNTLAAREFQTIMYLSKVLNDAKKRYWPTELEVATLMCTLRKIKHFLNDTPGKPTIIFTNHSATIDIAKQTKLSSSSATRLNLGLAVLLCTSPNSRLIFVGKQANRMLFRTHSLDY